MEPTEERIKLELISKAKCIIALRQQEIQLEHEREELYKQLAEYNR